MKCIILFCNPCGGSIGAIMDEKNIGRIYQYESRDDAQIATATHPLLKAWPHQIVELDEPLIRSQQVKR